MDVRFEQIPSARISPRDRIGVAFKATWKEKKLTVRALRVDTLTEEHQKLGSLNHPNITRLEGWFKLGDNIYLVTPIYPTVLSEKLYSENIPFEQRMQWADHVHDGLTVLHNANLLHLHLNPNTVLLDSNNQAILTDIACLVSEERPDSSNSLPFQAPEKLLTENPKPDTRWDIYSFGVFIWCCVTQKKPFAGLSFEMIMFAISSQKRENIPPNTPPKLAHLIQFCWAQDPNSRPQHMSDIEKSSILFRQ